MRRVYGKMLRFAASAAVLFLAPAAFAAADAGVEAPKANAAAPAGIHPAQEEPKGQAEAKKPALHPELSALRDAVRRVLDAERRQSFNTRQNSATEILSVCRAFGCAAEVSLDGPDGRRINAITCLCWNYPCGGFELLGYDGRRIAPRVGYGRQERPGEFLAVLALARVPADYPVRVGSDVRKVADVVEAERLGCRAGDDASLRLLGLAYYAGEPTWKNELGETWSIERMIEEELEQPMAAAPEGGLDRLTALGFAVARRGKQSPSLEGQYQRARKFVAEYHEYALAMQNADGSWGPRYLAARGAAADPATQLRATGRVLEWLALTLPEEQLTDRRVTAAVAYVVRLLGGRPNSRNTPSLSTREIVDWGHALHALAVYDERVFRPYDDAEPAK